MSDDARTDGALLTEDARAVVERVLISELADNIAIIDDPVYSDGDRQWARTRAEATTDLGRRLGFTMADLRYLAMREVQARQEYLRQTAYQGRQEAQ